MFFGTYRARDCGGKNKLYLWIWKTYARILRYIFWPGLKSALSAYCWSCHIHQVVGKPNQKISPTILYTIPVLGESFGCIIIDCVGPLPKSKSGYHVILAVMCAATRLPEAFPL